MWKLAIGFVVFAAVALFVIMKAGDKVDMRRKHGADAIHAPAESNEGAAALDQSPASGAFCEAPGCTLKR